MSEETVTTFICDRCGLRSEKSDFSNGDQSGRLYISYKGTQGMLGYDGAWGGLSINETKLLCFNCVHDFMDFIKPLEQSNENE